MHFKERLRNVLKEKQLNGEEFDRSQIKKVEKGKMLFDVDFSELGLSPPGWTFP